MRVQGYRVYLNMPELPESKIELSPELKNELKKEMAKKFDKLEVFAIGDGVTTNVAKGDIVKCDPFILQKAPIIEIDGKEKISVSCYDIMHIW